MIVFLLILALLAGSAQAQDGVCGPPGICLPALTPTATPTPLTGGCGATSFQELIALGADHIWRFDELAPATQAADSVDADPGTYTGQYILTGHGVDLHGLGSIPTSVTYDAPQEFTYLTCFYGTTGVLASWAPRPSDKPSAVLSVSNAGTVWWGITYGDGQQQLVPPSVPSWSFGLGGTGQPIVSDGTEHLVVASLGAAGQKIYLDGRLLATRPYRVFIAPTPSAWTFGYGAIAGWPATSTFNYTGRLKGAAWWQTQQLSDAQVLGLWQTRTPTPTPTPVPTPVSTNGCCEGASDVCHDIVSGSTCSGGQHFVPGSACGILIACVPYTPTP